MTTLRAGAASDTGRVRTNNEDSLLVAEPLFAVADGMGGHQGGEVASAVALAALREAFERDRSVEGLVEAVRAANEAVTDRAADDPGLAGMGTTLTAVALVPGAEDDDELVVVNVGDSRTYLLRQGELQQLSEDDSLVADLVRAGQITAAEARVHPRRNIVTRVVGSDGDLWVDPLQLIPVVGDRLLLCSDGLTDEVDDDTIAAVLRRLADPEDAAAELVELARGNGGSDNITVVIVDVVDDGGRAEAASAVVAAAPRDGTSRMLSYEDRNRALRDLGEEEGPSGMEGTWSATAPAEALDEPTRRFTWRVGLFLLVLVLLLGGAAAAVVYAARGTYYVGADGQRVTIFQGRPGGLLWFRPTVRETTRLTLDDLPPAARDDVRAGKQEASLADARAYASRLAEQAATQVAATSTTTTSLAPTTGAPAAPTASTAATGSPAGSTP